MQMTKTAALAILAFVSTAAAQYYPEAEYGSVYARDAEPEYDDVYDIYARDAEPEAEAEWDLHPRDAYMEGFEAGLFARGPTTPPKAAAAKPPTPQQREQRITAKEGRVQKDENKLKGTLATERKELAALEAKMKGQQGQLKADQGRMTKLGNAYNRAHNQEINAAAKQRRALYDLYDFDY